MPSSPRTTYPGKTNALLLALMLVFTTITCTACGGVTIDATATAAIVVQEKTSKDQRQRHQQHATLHGVHKCIAERPFVELKHGSYIEQYQRQQAQGEPQEPTRLPNRPRSNKRS